jgi:hypothetical protein
MLQENLGNKYEIDSISKPNAPLTHMAEELGKLSKGLAKQDHVVTVVGPEINTT